MSNEALKSEAKRLRTAITDMFGIPVSVAQSLELIAKTKNYPTWDAASACESPRATGRTVNPFQLTVYHRQENGRIGGAFSRDDDASGVLYDLNDLTEALSRIAAREQHTGRVICHTSEDGSTAVIAPEWDEAVHGFESHPYQISVTSSPGAFHGKKMATVGIGQVGAELAKLVAQH